MNEKTIEQAVEFLQSLATLSVEAQSLLRAGEFDKALDLIECLAEDLQRATDLTVELMVYNESVRK